MRADYPKPRKKGREYFAKAAQHGNADAEENLAELYQYGLGVPKNPYKAYTLFTESILMDDNDPARAQQLRPRLEAVRAQLTKAQQNDAYAQASATVYQFQTKFHTTTFGRERQGVETGPNWVWDG